ncbi:hypothetical protein NBRC116598_36700 [Pseudophaeobacter arcticus]|uniref:Transposase n=1 Tax=Pseudophaeobacter arcticus TaxID=385492 RepID=A0ABQ0AQS6_9RHOB
MQFARVSLRRVQGATAPEPKAKRSKRQQDNDKPECWHLMLRYGSGRKWELDLVQELRLGRRARPSQKLCAGGD